MSERALLGGSSQPRAAGREKRGRRVASALHIMTYTHVASDEREEAVARESVSACRPTAMSCSDRSLPPARAPPRIEHALSIRCPLAQQQPRHGRHVGGARLSVCAARHHEIASTARPGHLTGWLAGS